MADAPAAGGRFAGLTKRWHGAPVWVWTVGGGATAFLAYRWWKSQAGSSTNTATGPSLPAGYDQGYGSGAGSGAGGGGSGSTGTTTGSGLPTGGLSSGTTGDAISGPNGSTIYPGSNWTGSAADIAATQGQAISPGWGYGTTNYGQGSWDTYLLPAGTVPAPGTPVAPSLGAGQARLAGVSGG